MPFYVIGEDALTCALGKKLLEVITGASPIMEPINTKGVTKMKAAVSRYAGLVHQAPVLCLADTDGKCVVEMLRDWFPAGSPDRFLMRFAISEAESWLLADARGFSEFLGISEARIPREPDLIRDPKAQMLTLAARSSKRIIREEMIGAFDRSKPGNGYNLHLCNFVASNWNPHLAAANSESLRRAISRIAENHAA